jgi:AsmA protein
MRPVRIAKIAAWTLAGLAALAIIAVVAVAAVVDGAFVKSRLERAMKERGRTLAIEGEPVLRLFPVAGLALGRTRLSEPNSAETFLSLESADVAVRVLPLLSGTLVVEKLAAHGVRANVRKQKDGRMNFDDLVGERDRRGETADNRGGPAARGEARRRLPRLVVGELDVDRAQLSYADEATGQQLELGELTVKLARLSGQAPSPLTASATLTGRHPDVSLKAQASGDVRLDLAHESVTLSRIDARIGGNADQAKNLDLRLAGDVMADGRKGELEVNGLALSASGTLDRDALTATLSAPRISVAASKATGSAVTGTMRIQGPDRRLDAKLDVAPAEGSSGALTFPQVRLALEATADGGVLKAALNSPVKADLRRKTWELPKLSADLSLSHPKLPQKIARLPIEAKLLVDHAKQTLALNAAADAEEFDFKLDLAAKRFKPLDASFDLASRRMNVDRYPFVLGGAAGAKKDGERIDLSGLAGPSLHGKIRIGALQANNVKLSDVAAELKLARGTLELAPHSAKLYDGALSGTLVASARNNQVSLKETLQGVQINPLLRDLAKKDLLEGRGDVSIDVTGTGATVPAFKRSLAGMARMQLKDGALKGINLAEVFRRAQAALGRGAAPGGAQVPAGGAQKTDFTELAASFAIKDGVAYNEDLTLKSPFVRAAGSGKLDIGAATLDYLVKPTLVASAAGQQGRYDLSGVTVPVRIHGPLDALRYEVDYGGLLTDSVKQRLADSLKERLDERLGAKPADPGAKGGAQGETQGGAAPAPASPADQARDQLRERLKGLLGR